MSVIQSDLRKRIKNLRKEFGFSEERMAAHLGLFEEEYIAFENGEQNYETDYAILVVIAHTFGVSVEYLLGQEEIIKSPKETKRLSECIEKCGEEYIKDILSFEEKMTAGDFRDMADILPVVNISSAFALLLTAGLGAGEGYYIASIDNELCVVRLTYKSGEVCFISEKAVYPARYGAVSIIGKLIAIDKEGAL